MIVPIIIVVLLSVLPIMAIIYDATGFGKKFYHDILGWHKPDNEIHVKLMSTTFESRCKYCNKEIMEDSQGNWY